eukprot:GFKZ01010397.1.p2 GENE.GFKZ01010397.1~~GFKZ01010397.1.p2  ORF type:complete len:305 (+),score=45.92 GFKZ01010397.1:71-916(+)
MPLHHPPSTPTPRTFPSPSPACLTFTPSLPLHLPRLSTRPPARRPRPSTPLHAPLRTPLHLSLSEDPVTTRLRAELAADGLNYDDLLNASKVVNLTRKVEALTLESRSLPATSSRLTAISEEISRLEAQLEREKRSVMRAWLKNLFLAQAYVFMAVGGVLANDWLPPVWSVPLVARALGFWMVWLFTIPALRARKGTSRTEKSALNVAFVMMPVLNVAMPVVTKNTGFIWAADVALLAACYLYYGVKAVNEAEEGAEEADVSEEQARVKGILRYLDWGSWR